MRQPHSPRVLLLALLTAAATFVAAAPAFAADAPAVRWQAGGGGLQTLTVAGRDVLADGKFQVVRVVFAKADGNTYSPQAKGETEIGKDCVILRYPWGRVACSYGAPGPRLILDITVTNRSADALHQLDLSLLAIKTTGELDWPRLFADAFGRLRAARSGDNLGEPTVLAVRDEKATIVACNDQPTGALRLTLNAGKDSVALKLQAGGGRMAFDDVYERRPVPPGKTDQYKVSLRFGDHEADVLALAADMLAAYAKAFPMTLNWPDRRPIQRMFPGGGLDEANAVARAKDLQAAEAGDKLDEKFRENALKKVRGAVAAAKALNAQGIIVWEIEGNRIGKITYVGDPRLTRWLNPQMDLVADEFFKVMRDAGLRPGVCIRPSRVIFNAEKDTVQHSYSPAKDPFTELDAKIRYAQQRWGCTLFYIDTNIFWRARGPEGKWSEGLIAPEVWGRLQQAHPDVLLIPELGVTQYHAYTAPYSEMDMGSRGTPEAIRSIWPKGFGCLQLEDDDPVRSNDTIVQAVANGDILMTNGGQRQAVAVQGAYNEARFRAIPAKPEAKPDPDRYVAQAKAAEDYQRWYAAGVLGHIGGDKAVEALIGLLADPNWTVRKAACVALGEVKAPAAVKPLVELMCDREACMDYVAGRALAAIGEPAVGALAENVKTPGHAGAAAMLALGQIGGDKAADALAPLVEETKLSWQARNAVFEALGRIATDKAVAALVKAVEINTNPYLLGNAASALARTGSPKAKPAIQAAIDKQKAAEKPDREALRLLNDALRRAR